MTAIGALFLLGPLIVVPLGLRLIDTRGSLADRLHASTVVGSLPAAAALVLAMMLPAGGLPALLALPWIFVTLAHLGAASANAGGGDPRSRKASAWIDIVGAVYLVIGAAWVAIDRLGLQLLGFDPVVVRLTAVHFHFAGFTLLLVAGRLAERRDRLAARAAAASVAIGVPLVALGFLGLPVAGLAGVLGVAVGGVGIGALQLRAAASMGSSAARWLARLGGVAMFVTMPMAVVWQLGQVGWLAPIHWLDLTTMIRVHGVLNALGFAVTSMVAWTLDRMSQVAEPRRPDGERAPRAFAIGGVVGVLGGFLVLEIPVLGVLIVALGAIAPPRPATASGVLVGASVGMAALLLVASSRCTAETGCSGPDLSGWIVTIGACLGVGLGLAAAAARRASRPSP